MDNVEVGIVLQARMGSSRLPGKVLLPFGESTLLEWLFGHLSGLPWRLVVATSVEPRNGEIESICRAHDVEVFRGSEEDVLDRYAQVTSKYQFGHVVRLTADNPFPDIDEIVRLVRFHVECRNDYSHNIGSLPVGVGAEVITKVSIDAAAAEGREEHHREHVNDFILENPHRFKIGVLEVSPEKQCPKLRLTIDTKDDYQRITRCLGCIPDRPITTPMLIKRCLSFA